MYLHSTFELVYVIYNLDKEINIQRNYKGYKYLFQNEEHIYYPDFICDGNIIEIKGRETLLDLEKYKAKFDKPFKVLYSKDLVDMYKYVIKKYKVSKDLIYTLYEKNKEDSYNSSTLGFDPSGGGA